MHHDARLENVQSEIDQAERIEELLRENEALKNQLSRGNDNEYHQNTTTQSRKRRRCDSSEIRTDDESTDLKRQLDLAKSQVAQLNARYQFLFQDHTRHLELFAQVQQKYKDAKRYCREWRRYYNEHPTRAPRAPGSRSSADGNPEISPRNESRPDQIEQMPAVSPTIKAENEDTPRQFRHEGHPSSQTTASETDDMPSLANANETSSPVLVSTRAVGRKRPHSRTSAPSPTIIKQEIGSPTLPMDISSESGDNTSSKYEQGPPLFHQVSDLDVAQTLATPRKHHRHTDDHPSSRRKGLEDQDSKTWKPLSTTVSSLSHNQANQLDKTKTENGTEAWSNAQASSHHPNAKALQPLNANTIASPRPTNTKDRRYEKEHIAKIAEDGEVVASVPMHAVKDKLVKASVTPAADVRHSRLFNLLDRPDVADTSATADLTPEHHYSRRSRHGHKSASSLRPSDKAGESRDLFLSSVPPTASVSHADSPHGGKLAKPTPSRTRRKNSTTDKHPIGTSSARQGKSARTTTPTTPVETPLRQRPLASLTLDDFKINPAHAGSAFAFSETIRGREARRCLEGCTNPDCCGTTFLKTIEMGGGGGGGGTGKGHLSASTSSEAALFEEHLGPDWRAAVRHLTPDEQHQILARSRARAFANQFGKHRHVFERRRTPPGFWRTDMPSTQESAEDRAQATAMEKDQVQTRWLEALRPDGRWSFRDENREAVRQ